MIELLRDGAYFGLDDPACFTVFTVLCSKNNNFLCVRSPSLCFRGGGGVWGIILWYFTKLAVTVTLPMGNRIVYLYPKIPKSKHHKCTALSAKYNSHLHL